MSDRVAVLFVVAIYSFVSGKLAGDMEHRYPYVPGWRYIGMWLVVVFAWPIWPLLLVADVVKGRLTK